MRVARRGFVAPAVQNAFAPQRASSSEAPPQPVSTKGGLEVIFQAQFEVGLHSAVKMPHGPLLVAATADGSVKFVDSSDGSVVARSDDVHDDPPNVIVCASQWVLYCTDDASVQAISIDGAVMHQHTVVEPAQDGKRQRCCPVDHAVVLDDHAYVAAAGRLVHACRVDGNLEHTVNLESPVRAMCAAPSSDESMSMWAYAIACSGGVQLISRAGEMMRQLDSQRMLLSLSASGPCLAAGAMDGTIELWDLVTPRHGNSTCHWALRGYCGSDGNGLAWRADGGGLTITGKRAAVFDFTGANPHHPYRNKDLPPAEPGQPDVVPRVGMSDPAKFVAWAPRASESPTHPTEMATLDGLGVVRLWNPHGMPMRKGGNGNPSQPQLMKPQFYIFPKHDATHPSGEAKEACALMWLREGVVAVGYFSGEIVAWRIAATTG